MKSRHLLESEKIAIYAVLLHHSTNGKLRYGDLKQQASLYNVAERTIQRVWAQGQAQRSFKSPPSRQRKPADILSLQERVSKLPPTKKMDLRTMSEALHVPKSTLHDALVAGVLVRKHSSLKPLLTDANKEARKRHFEQADCVQESDDYKQCILEAIERGKSSSSPPSAPSTPSHPKAP
ncbi:hypothetical protein DYB36_007947 [Aphanomyces astaci]|uniref:DUF7769 domain-containing protein n=1 Tax=Aphanomyces astaci TaxID=112090 RepID=A0A397BVP2_APHAT|nr:hypothetical protein DYB36_007947 [Aphanomyces astaci]